MKKILLTLAATLFAAAFTVFAQTKADLSPYIGEWSFTCFNPMTNQDEAGIADIQKGEDGNFHMTLTGMEGTESIRTETLDSEDGKHISTSFYMAEYTYVVPIDFTVADENTINATINTGGYRIDFTMTRKK